MDEGMISVVANWLPLVVFLIVFAFISLKSNAYYKRYDKHVSDVLNANAELVAINKEMARTLVEIRTLLQTGKS